MLRELIVCLDGSSFAEKILPYARAIVGVEGTKLTLLRVVENETEFAAAQDYLRGCAERWGGGVEVKIAQADAASSILEELRQKAAIAAITTHGCSGLLEALLGSVALSVIRGAHRPVLLYRPRAGAKVGGKDKEVKINSVVVALDGSEFSASILPFAAEMAKSIKGKVELVQVLPPQGGGTGIPRELRRDVLESSYLHRQAEVTRNKCGVEVDWDVLHGDPANAICGYIRGRDDVILAMTTHARAALQETVFGSVTSECVRQAGVLLLVYWPRR